MLFPLSSWGLKHKVLRWIPINERVTLSLRFLIVENDGENRHYKTSPPKTDLERSTFTLKKTKLQWNIKYCPEDDRRAESKRVHRGLTTWSRMKRQQRTARMIPMPRAAWFRRRAMALFAPAACRSPRAVAFLVCEAHTHAHARTRARTHTHIKGGWERTTTVTGAKSTQASVEW